jgi:FG-GAP-like repeat/FG-GAP repeat
MSCGTGVRRLALVFALAVSLVSAAFASNISFSKTFVPVPSAAKHADFNNDGREDVIARNAKGGLDVALSTGDGAYGSPVSYAIPGGADVSFFAIGDFNSDGKADLAVVGSDNAIHLFLNNGSGKFSQSAAFPVQNVISLNDIAVGDFNRDGVMDIAFTNALNLTVWFGNGRGGFTVGPTIPVSNTDYLMLGDFDGDGLADLAIGDRNNYDSVEVLYGNGKGQFPARSLIQTSGNGHFLFSAADVNGDGKMDIIGSQFYPSVHSVSIFYGNAGRTWTKGTTIPLLHCSASSATAADVNGDGINDLIVGEADCNNNSQQGNVYVGVLTRNSNSSYNAEQIVFTSRFYLGNVTAIRSGRNTKPDITFQHCINSPCVVAHDLNTAMLLNTTAGNFPSCAAPNAFEGINVCSPAAGATITSPVSFKVGAAGQVAMRDVEVWVDGKKVAVQIDGFSHYTFLNRSISLAKGKHTMGIFAAGWDQSLQKKTFTLTVK